MTRLNSNLTSWPQNFPAWYNQTTMLLSINKKATQEEIKEYIDSIDKSSLSKPFKKTFDKFLEEYLLLEKENIKTQQEKPYWAEKMMTWGNILTHRARII